MRRALALLVLATLSLTGCGGLQGTDAANFTTGDGSIVQVAADERGEPLDIAGNTLDGGAFDLADLRGGIVVLNLWGSWCNPCRDEAPVLEEAARQLDATFVGMSFRETNFAAARGVQREFGISYPTIADDGSEVLELGRFAPQSPPTTYVLDSQGRVAAVVTGAITSVVTLTDLVAEVAAEDG